tara:strand:- start:359 stop:1210 length:852 start_codon:yes stop_codon:yes gene_type:complete
MENKKKNWDIIIRPKNNFFQINFLEIYKYRDLIKMFVIRDFVTFYKQTILGPLWYVIQPLINTIVFTIIFGNLAKISTDGVPPFLFYLAGNVVWSYFAVCLTTTSNTFIANADIFGKVYFPRLTVPIANVIISLLQFLLQFIFFLAFLIYFYFRGVEINIGFTVMLLPLILFQMAILGLGVGILIASLTTKYKDLTFLMTFGVQLWMFATPVVYPLSIVPENYRIFIILNPMTSIVEIFKKIFLGQSSIELHHVLISIIITLFIFFLGLFNFGKMEKNFMDTI